MEAMRDPLGALTTAPVRPGGGAAALPDPLEAARRENFPVASRLIRRDLRPAVLAFYRFARAADDVADDPALPAAEKLARLDAFEAALRGGPGVAHGAALRDALAPLDRGGAALEQAARLLEAFRQDARGAGCPDWATLRDYCARSADPVGRFLLLIHDEDEAASGPSDALCTALQVLNHLQDLRADCTELGRVYLPADWLAAAGAAPGDLAAPSLSPSARRAVDRALDECDGLLSFAAPLPGRIRSPGLRAQAAATLFLARRLSARLRRDDPLHTRVRAPRQAFAMAVLVGLGHAAWRRP